MEFDNPLRRQVLSLPELLKQQYADLEPKTRTILNTAEIYSIQRIILTGCGDSYAACMGMKYVFEKFTGIKTECVTALDLSRFYEKKFLGYSPNNPLVIAVSNSGQVARIGEAVERINKYGGLTLGITGKRDSVLAKAANRIVELAIPKFESAPGTRTYMVTVLALFLIAVRIGEVRAKYTMDTAKAYRKDILAQADMLHELLATMDKQALELAYQWKEKTAFDFIGAGLDYASAWFGHAKIYEAIGAYATHINSEEWLHLNFFMKNIEQIATIVFCTIGNSAFSRTKETLAYAAELGRSLAVITDGTESDFNVPAVYFKVPQTTYPYTAFLTQFTPVCLLSGYIQAMTGEKSGRGCEGPWAFSKNAACVRQSEIIIL